MRSLKLFLFFCLVLVPGLSFGQVGNEWINYGQTYYKIPVAKDGIYKLTQENLAQAGVPVTQVDPRRLQLFHRGIEQAILVQHLQSPADGVFDAGEYLEFYGKKNDGTLDKFLYKPSTAQPHEYYNLYNDTAYYFLTVHPSLQGKRMSTFSQLNTSALPAETYQTTEQLQLFTSSYAVGETVSGAVQLTEFDQGEGWSGAVLRENTNSDVVVNNLTNGVPSAGLPTLNLQVLGRAFTSHKVEVYVGQSAGSLRLVTTADFFGYTPFTVSNSLEWSDISAGGALTVRVRIVGTGSADFVSLSFVKVSYPRNFSMGGDNERLFSLATVAGGKSYVEIQNPPSGARVFDITDSNNLITIGTTQTTSLNAVINNTQEARKLFITNQSITPSAIKHVVFRSMSSLNANFVIITHKQFQKAALGSANPVKSYATYRASAEGGAYDTLSVTIDQLFNQFSYGESTPLAIFRFLKFLETQKRPDYLFLIGKGLDVSNRYYRNPTAFTEYKDYVPVAGNPSSDMYYSVGLSDPNTNEPGIPTGRLSATQPEDVIRYLNKVIEQEALGHDALWRKEVLHLSGGIAEGEPETFKGYLEDFAATAVDVYLGGSVDAIAKRSLEAQVLINISDEVNAGLGLITFFGHSSSSTTDFDIGFATDPTLGYDNKGKYPMLLINGCNAGAFFNNRILFGEDWINAADKGAVGFIAHSSFGLASTLKRYSDIFYQVAYGDSTFLKRGVGDVQKEVARRYLLGQFLSMANISQVQQMILLGDPAVKLFGAEKPDYAIDATSVSITAPDGKPLSASASTAIVKTVVKNFGRAEAGELKLSVRRTLPDNKVVTYDSVYQAVFYQDTLLLSLPNSFAQAGSNQFEVMIDADDTFDELNESNNGVSFPFFIPLNGTKNLFPQDFAVIASTQPELIFQSANLLDSLRWFVVQVDTSYLFDSPWKIEQSVQSELLNRVPLTLQSADSLTYYWRTRLKYPATEENAAWQSSSFTYVQGSVEAWGQVSFPQFYENSTDALLLNGDNRSMVFEPTTTPVLIRTFGDLNTAPVTEVSVKIDGSEYNLATQGQPCRDNTINLLAFNRSSTIPYAGIPFNFQDPRTCGREPQVIVSFLPTEVFNAGVNDLIQYVNDVVVGDSVVLFSIGNPSVGTWHPDVVTALSGLGISAAQLSSLAAGEPFVIYGKKGAAPESALVFKSELSPATEQELVVNRTITGFSSFGSMTSTFIGPAQQWYKLKTKAAVKENDDFTLDVYGVTASGTVTLLLQDLTIETDLSTLSASDYPFLKLVYTASDGATLTPPQLSFWMVEYEALPEGVLYVESDRETLSLEEGEDWTKTFGFINVSTKSFADSVTVRYASINKNTNAAEEKQQKIGAPLPGDTTRFQLSVSSLEKPGLNDVNINVNPAILPEIFLDNNIMTLSDAFTVRADDSHPVLSVLVDGRILQNGDFVSPNPRIEISVWDENELILKTDTTGMRVLLQYPCEANCSPTQIYFTRSDVQWAPATSTTPFQVVFNPSNLAEGIYILQVVAEDSRGNESGEDPYEIAFEVKSAQSLTLSKPYPNPTQGRLSFEMILTGSEVPAGAWFEVMDSMGKLLYEGAIPSSSWHIGTNHFTVEMTDQLVGGVYLYRIRFANGLVLHGQFVSLD